MGAASGIRAGKAFVELGTHDAALVRGLRAAQMRLKAWGAVVQGVGLRISAAGAALTAPFVLATRAFVSAGSEMLDMAARTGVAVESLGELAYAAKQSGSSAEELEAGIRKMQRSVVDAGDGTATAVDALARLGLTAGHLLAMKPEDQFTLIAERLRDIADPTLRAATAMELFGRSGTSLLPMMNDLEALRAEAKRLGIAMSTDDARAAHKLGDAFDLLRGVTASLWNAIGSALAPALTKATNAAGEMLATIVRWVRENKGAVIAAAQVAAGVTAAGVAVTGLGLALAGASVAAGALATITGLLTSPFVIAGAAAAVLAVRLGAVGRMTEWVGRVWQWLGPVVGDVVREITDALGGGDIEGALRLVGAGMRVIWLEVWSRMLAPVQDFKADVLDIWDSLTLGPQAMLADFFKNTARGFALLRHIIVDAMADAFAAVGKLAISSMSTVAGVVAGIWDKLFGTNYAAALDTIAGAARRAVLDLRATLHEGSQAIRDKRLDEIDRLYEKRLISVADADLERQRARAAAADAEATAAQKELADARAAWERARAVVRGRAAAPGAPGMPGVDVDGIQQAVARAMTVTGTFSGAALWGIGRGREQELNELRGINRNTAKIADRRGATFA